MKKYFMSPASKSLSSAFTLIELIVVIIIVGILAAVGISQYSKTVEKGRGAEARMLLGITRKLAYQYYMENGTLASISSADLNIGTAADQIPSACRDTHYFYYGIRSKTSSMVQVGAWRCTSGGKTPQGDPSWSCVEVALSSELSTGNDCWVFHSCGTCTP